MSEGYKRAHNILGPFFRAGSIRSLAERASEFQAAGALSIAYAQTAIGFFGILQTEELANGLATGLSAMADTLNEINGSLRRNNELLADIARNQERQLALLRNRPASPAAPFPQSAPSRQAPRRAPIAAPPHPEPDDVFEAGHADDGGGVEYVDEKGNPLSFEAEIT